MTTTVVTGLGVIAPTGLGVDDYWKATLEGRNGIAPITKFDASGYPSSLAGQVVGFHAADHLPGRLLPQTDHMTRMALAAAQWAWDDAGLDPAQLPEFSAGVVTASSSGGYEFGERELRNLWAKGASYVSAYQSFAWFYAVNTGQISIRHQMRGPTGVLVSDQAGGADAIAHARRQIRKGARVMLAGGVDSSLCSWGWIAHLASGRVSTADDPRRAYLPFSADAEGTCPGKAEHCWYSKRKPQPGPAAPASTGLSRATPPRSTLRPEAAVPAPWKRPCAAPSPTRTSTPTKSTWSSATAPPSRNSTGSKPQPSTPSSGKGPSPSPFPRP